MASKAEIEPAVDKPRLLMQKCTPHGVKRYLSDGNIVVADLVAGERGFAMAHWPASAGQPSLEDTEIPNLNLPGVLAGAVAKRPAAPAPETPAAPAPKKRPATDDIGPAFRILFYRKTHAIAIRRSGADGNDKTDLPSCWPSNDEREDASHRSADIVP